MIVALDKALRLQKITYVVIGGIAASLHGRPWHCNISLKILNWSKGLIYDN